MRRESRVRRKHEGDRGRAAQTLTLLLVVGLLPACSEIPAGRSAIDAVSVENTKTIKAGDVEDSIATGASTKFLYLFQGVAYDYAIYDEAVLQRDMSRVERFYRSKGFFDARARVARLFQDSKRHVHVEILVDEGPPTMNRRIRIAGMEALPKPTVTAVLNAAALAVPPGARFDEDKLKASEAAVKKALTDLGYAYATSDVQAEVDIGEHTADYGFKVVPGPLCTFGAITITGLDPNGPRKQEIPEAPLRRAINIDAGTPYSTAEIDSATQALLDLEVFSAVSIVPTLPQPPPPHPVVALTVKVEPTRLREVTLGGGIELDEIKTDLHAVTGWEDHNFLGGLRDFSVEFKPGVVLYPLRIGNFQGALKPLPEEWLKLELKQPGLFEARTSGFIRPQFNIFPLLVETKPDPATTKVVGYKEVKVPVGIDRTFFKKLYVAVDYTVQVESPFSYVGGLDPALETVILSYPELVTHIDLRDNSVRPHEGIYLGNTLQVAGGIFGGKANDVRVQPEVRTYIPVAHGVTFATRASVGFLWASSYGKDWQKEISNSPTLAAAADTDASRTQLVHDTQTIYFRGFFSGGPTTNRGFPILGVAPHAVVPFLNPATASQAVKFGCDPSTQAFKDNLKNDIQQCFLPVGGFTLWELQNETRFDISGPLSASVFCDMSDVSPNPNDIRLGHLHLSCGIGAAYDTPVGPIRLNIGYRVQPLQVLGYKNETAAADADPTNGVQPTIFGVPLAIAIGIGQAY
jgi:outer membrane protein assembly factor BamA